MLVELNITVARPAVPRSSPVAIDLEMWQMERPAPADLGLPLSLATPSVMVAAQALCEQMITMVPRAARTITMPDAAMPGVMAVRLKSRLVSAPRGTVIAVGTSVVLISRDAIAVRRPTLRAAVIVIDRDVRAAERPLPVGTLMAVTATTASVAVGAKPVAIKAAAMVRRRLRPLV